MNNNLKNKLGALKRRAALTPGERETMRHTFTSYMEEHVPPPGHEVTPSVPRIQAFLNRARYSYIAMVPMTALIVLVVASEYALPTEPLYAVKKSVNDNVILGSASLSPYTKVRAEKLIIARRLREVEKLINEEKLEPAAVRALTEDIDEQLDHIHARIKKSSAEGNIDEALDVGSQLEGMLGGYSIILGDASKTQPLSEDMATLLSTVAEHDSELSRLGDELEDTFVAQTSAEDFKEYVGDVGEVIQEELDDLADRIHDLDLENTPPLITDVIHFQNEAEHLYASSTDDLPETPNEALTAVHDALETIEQANTILTSQEEQEAHQGEQ